MAPAPGQDEKLIMSHTVRSRFAWSYRIDDLYPGFTCGPTMSVARCPPHPFEIRIEQRLSWVTPLLARSASSQTTKRTPSPPGWNSGKARIAGTFWESQLSAAESGPSCASFKRLGVM